MLIERVVLRDITDVAPEFVQIGIKGLIIEQDLAAGGLQLAGQHFQQSTLPATACPHHTNQFAAHHIERNSFQPDIAATEAVRNFAHLERANDVALFLDDALGKIALQELADVDPNGVAIL